MHLPEPASQALGWLAFVFAEAQPYLPTYLHLLLSALFPIFTAAYASLARPPSAAKPKQKKLKHGFEVDAADSESKMEGLTTTDALLFPVIAGITLASLYFIIQWLNDPALLNLVLNWYFGIFSIFAVARMVSDGLDFVHSLAFPHEHVVGGVIYSVQARTKSARPLNRVGAPVLKTPLPGPFSKLPLPKPAIDFLWFLHTLPSRKLTFKAHFRGLLDVKAKLGIHGIEGLVIGLVSMLYFNMVAKPWWLTNLAGFAFAYGTLQILSPTTFLTGTIILVGLFFYDIYFVFYTPMMVTVATKLEIPAKLLFPRPSDLPGKKSDLAMLGLGDVVLPGIMIGLALRFDLYMFYLKKQTKVVAGEALARKAKDKEYTLVDKPADGEAIKAADNAADKGADEDVGTDLVKDADTETTKDAVPKAEKTATASAAKEEEKEAAVIKAPYLSTSDAWGDRLWTSALLSHIITPGNPSNYASLEAFQYQARNVFPKPYFTVSLLGYILGMITTLVAMQLTDHPQPALLYLVPGVVGSLWLTAFARGEIKDMWTFSEAMEEEEEARQKAKAQAKAETREKKALADKKTESEGDKKRDTKDQKTKEKGDSLVSYFFNAFDGGDDDNTAESDGKRRQLVSLEIHAPAPFPYEVDTPSYRPVSKGKDSDEEHPEKRLRVG